MIYMAVSLQLFNK